MSLSEKAFLELLTRDRPDAIRKLCTVWVEGWLNDDEQEVVRHLTLWATRKNGRLPRIELGDDTTIMALARDCGLVFDADNPVFRIRRVDHDAATDEVVDQTLTLVQARSRAYRSALNLRNQYDITGRETITVCEAIPGANEDEHIGYQVYREGVLVVEFLIEADPTAGVVPRKAVS